jgi:hypothetical protein
MQQLDYLLGKCVIQIMKKDFIGAVSYLEDRINSNEKDVARCKPVSEKESNEIVQSYNFNIGTALKHIFAFTRTIKKGNRPNKAELKAALRYIKKEMERTSNEQN